MEHFTHPSGTTERTSKDNVIQVGLINIQRKLAGDPQPGNQLEGLTERPEQSSVPLSGFSKRKNSSRKEAPLHWALSSPEERE